MQSSGVQSMLKTSESAQHYRDYKTKAIVSPQRILITDNTIQLVETYECLKSYKCSSVTFDEQILLVFQESSMAKYLQLIFQFFLQMYKFIEILVCVLCLYYNYKPRQWKSTNICAFAPNTEVIFGIFEAEYSYNYYTDII